MDTLFDIYISEAFDALDEIVEIPLYNAIFEDASEEMKKVEKSNDVSDIKAGNRLAKAFNVVKNFLIKLIQKFKAKVKYLTSDRKYKDDFKKFKERCKKDPKFANTKITITDYDEYLKKYEKAISDAEAAYKASLNDDDEINTNKDFMAEALKKAGCVAGTLSKPVLKQVTIQAAINIASTKMDRARRMLQLVQGDYDAIFTILKEAGVNVNGLDNANMKLSELLGEKDKKKLEKKLKRLSHRWGWVRNRAGAREHVGDSCIKAVADIHKNIGSIFLKVSNDPDVREKITDPMLDAGVDIVKATAGNLNDVRKQVKDNNKAIRRANRRYKKELKAHENEDLYAIVKQMGYKATDRNIRKLKKGKLKPITAKEAAILRESARDIFLDDLL